MLYEYEKKGNIENDCLCKFCILICEKCGTEKIKYRFRPNYSCINDSRNEIVLERDSHYDTATIKCLECGFEKTYEHTEKYIQDATFEEIRDSKVVSLSFGHLILPESVAISIDEKGNVKKGKTSFSFGEVCGFIDDLQFPDGNEEYYINCIKYLIEDLHKIKNSLKRKLKKEKKP
jgi:hypothetical protein